MSPESGWDGTVNSCDAGRMVIDGTCERRQTVYFNLDRGTKTAAGVGRCRDRATIVAMTNLAVPGLGNLCRRRRVHAGRGCGRARRRARNSRGPTRRRRTPRCARRRPRSARDAAKLLAANAADVAAATAAGHDAAFVDRLTLTPKAVAAMADGLDQIAALPDPVGEITDLRYRPSGIQVGLMRVPLGVIGIVYESRPERHRGRRGTLPQGRQRDDPARRLRKPSTATRRSRPASTRASAPRACRRPRCR